jgi:putative transposase
MPNYRRYRVRGGTYFFTVNLLERRQDTLVWHIDVLRETYVRHDPSDRFILTLGWCCHHMHTVWTLMPGDDDFPNRWKSIKIRFVQAIPQTERRSKIRIAKGERGVYP